MHIAACFTLTVCFFTVSAQKVFSDKDTKADFSKYKTYAWLAPGDSILNRYRADKLYGGTITHVANMALKEKGMRIDTLQPDAIFVFNTQLDKITEYSQSPTLSLGVGVAGPGYYVAGAAPVAGGKISATTLEDGKLSYAMYDAHTGKIIWSGWAEKSFKLSDDIEKIITDYTKKIFKKLPVKH